MSDSGIQVKLTPCHPGEFIRREVLEEFGLSIAAASEILGLPDTALADLVNGKVPLIPETALRIEKAFDLKMELLLRLQAWYDTVRMREQRGQVDARPLMTAGSSKVKDTLDHPGDFIRAEVLGKWGLSVGDAAEFLGVSSESLTALLEGQADLTPELALRLEKAFNLDMRALLRIQAKYDTARMYARWEEVEVQVFDWAAHLAKADGEREKAGEGMAPQAGFEPAT